MGHAAQPLGPDFARRLLDRILAEVVRDTGAYAGGVYLLVPGRQMLGLDVMTGVPREFATPWARVGLASPLPVTDAVHEGRLIWVAAQGELARRYPRAALVLPYHLALAAAPITTDTSTWGALLLLWPGSHPETLNSTEHAAIESACERLAGLLRQAAEAGRPVLPGHEPRVLPQLRTDSANLAEAEAAVEFVDRLPGGGVGLDLEGQVTFVSRSAADLLGEPTRALIGSRLWDALPWLADPVYEDRYRAAVFSRRPTSFTVRRTDGQGLFFQLYPDASGISVRITPTRVEGRPDDRFAPEAGPGAAPTRVGAIYHLMLLAGALTEAVGVRDVADLVADQLLPAFGAQGLALLVAEGGRLHVVGARGYPPEILEEFDGTPLSSPTPGVRALTAGEPAFYGSHSELAEAYPALAEAHASMAAWAFLPLIASGRTVGCLLVAYDGPHPFTPDERAALSSLSGLIAQALDRARLYDAKHQLARTLQAGLLPNELPHVPGLEVAARYLPSTRGLDIGGDFYDLMRLDSRTAAAVIGDVQGHSVPAAALMGQVRTAVHAHAVAGAPPDAVLARTNRLLTDLDPGLFTSCLYVHLDLRRQRAWMASAGHPLPLLRHPGGRTEILSPPPGLLLGIDRDITYPTLEIPLPPGAVLALYTDGLIEAPGTDEDRTLAHLIETLSRDGDAGLDELADLLIQCAQPSGDRTDDTALLLLRLVPGDGD
ncbi:SpoIIE family protein phosphatase [Streptomyces sp. NPDC048639]|uniref:SpoIIE family protein phosphatase n=1 Tax=Streptomyces sp. NPDC048639 TaxID=3365581 RepID=UPI00370FFC54